MRLTYETAHAVSVNGMTAHAQPLLAGMVIEDRLRPFATLPSSTPRVTGTLQERIVRSSRDGTLAFYYRIRELTGADLGYGLTLRFWPNLVAADVDYRLDGLGDIGPQTIRCSPGDTQFAFDTPSARPVTPTALSRFMYIKMLSEPGIPTVTGTGYDTGGQIIIADVRWAVILPDCFRPVIA